MAISISPLSHACVFEFCSLRNLLCRLHRAAVLVSGLTIESGPDRNPHARHAVGSIVSNPRPELENHW